MLDKVLIGTAVWMASNETGRKTAKAGFKVLNKIGGYIVNAMPKGASGFFNGMDDFVKDVVSDGVSDEQEGKQ